MAIRVTVSLECGACTSREAHIELPENPKAGDKVDLTIKCAAPDCPQSVIYRSVTVEQIP